MVLDHLGFCSFKLKHEVDSDIRHSPSSTIDRISLAISSNSVIAEAYQFCRRGPGGVHPSPDSIVSPTRPSVPPHHGRLQVPGILDMI